MSISLCVMYWARPGLETELSLYLDGVLDRVVEHGGAMLQRGVTSALDDQPLEVHFVSFPTQDRLDNYMGDARRAALAPELERVMARMEVMKLTLQPVTAGTRIL